MKVNIGTEGPCSKPAGDEGGEWDEMRFMHDLPSTIDLVFKIRKISIDDALGEKAEHIIWQLEKLEGIRSKLRFKKEN